MFRIPVLAFIFVLAALNACAQTAATASLRQNGWVIDCFQESSTLSISTDRLGSVARDIQLNEETPSGLRRLTHLSARIGANGKLMIETKDPISAWEFDAQPGKLTIVTTDFHGVLTGWADSPDGRTVSRLLDPEGLPVSWQGTTEVEDTYGGKHAVHRSNLPRQNPEVLYLGLGHVAGGGLHSLFDRGLDVAVDFGDNSELQAAAGKNDAFALTIPVRDNATIQVTPDYFTHTLGLPFYTRYDDSHFHAAPMVWSSWTSYYEAVTEKDVTRNADWIAANLKPYGFEYVELDDGYDRGPEGHSWAENWDVVKFPHGPEWLTSYIHGKGLKAGVWIVPNAYAPALKEHPDWYLYDKQGKVLRDYSTPALDSTNPEVFKHLAHLFTKMDGLGFDYYKFDGELALPAYAPNIDKSRLHAPSADFIANYRDRLALIRRTIGPDRFIELCPTGTELNAVGFADSYFYGDDLYNNWQGMYSFFSSINSNLFLNHIVTYVMPGEGIELGERMTVEQAKQQRYAVTLEKERSREDPLTGFGTTLPEARTVVTYVALTGVAYSLASVMPELPEERVELLQATMPTLPILPIDLFSRGTESSWGKFKHFQTDYYIHHYPEVLDLKVDSPAGVYDVAAETNWRSESTERSLEFGRQLGLSDERSYVVFDFWKQQPLGVFKRKIDLSIDPHDTRVLLIHLFAGRPQLIGNSRHISGSYSIVSQGWDGEKKDLHGESLTVAGKEYTLWFAIPDGYEKASAQVSGKDGKTISAEWKQQGQFASLRFTGNGFPVEWQLKF
ncbi:MAG: alpha-galactosidase [Terracidiphilus sp.]